VNRHVKRLEHQLDTEVVGHRPAHDLAGVRVEHEGKIPPSLPASSIREVRHPEAIGSCLGTKLRLTVLARQGTAEPAPASGARASAATARADGVPRKEWIDGEVETIRLAGLEAGPHNSKL
jgi:hypothetical protein